MSNDKKRPPVFGEGFVSKKSRSDGPSNPKRAAIPIPDFSAFRSEVSPFKKLPQEKRRTGPIAFADNVFNETRASNRLPTAETPSRQRNTEDTRRHTARVHSPFRMPDGQLDSVQRRTAMTPIRARPPIFNLDSDAQNETPSRVASEKETPRRATPLHAPTFEFPRVEKPPSASKLGPLPRFDIGQRSNGKMKTMLSLELPMFLTQEQEELGEEELEMQRGLQVSPEKSGRKAKRFARGGLAERAQCLITRSSTSLTLWKKELESHASSSRNKPRPELRVLVQEVLQDYSPGGSHSRAAKNVRSVLTVCNVISSKSFDSSDGTQRPTATLLFSSSLESAGSSELSDVSRIRCGSVIHVYRPWLELSRTTSIPGQIMPSTDQPVNIPSCHHDLSTMLCSRFIVLADSLSS